MESSWRQSQGCESGLGEPGLVLRPEHKLEDDADRKQIRSQRLPQSLFIYFRDKNQESAMQTQSSDAFNYPSGGKLLTFFPLSRPQMQPPASIPLRGSNLPLREFDNTVSTLATLPPPSFPSFYSNSQSTEGEHVITPEECGQKIVSRPKFSDRDT